MLRFAHNEYLWGLALIPVFILLYIVVSSWKKRAFAQLGDKNVVAKMIPQVSFSRPRLKFILFIIAYALLIVGIRKRNNSLS